MKYIYYPLLLFTLSSCFKEKKVIYPSQIQNETYNSISSIINKDFLLDSAVMYFEKQATGLKYYYTHFDSIQKKSVLDPFYGAVIPFDSILQNKTSWKFLPGFKFQLNDGITYNYEPYRNINRIYGLENGSARPIEILHSEKNALVVRVFESFVTMNKEDYRFYNVLHFKEKGDSTKSTVFPSEFNASYNGTLPLPTLPSNELIGSRWVIYKVVKNFNTFNCSDTLTFKSRTDYTLNNGAVRNYTLQYITGTGMYSFSIYYCYTLGGSYSGQILPTFIKDGQINGLTMKNLYNDEKIIVWMKQI